MKERLFRFKKFAVSHSRSAMKVGVDGVMIGAWASCVSGKILDVGCGCGLIALMVAQRNPDALIDAIDIDGPSVEEARDNVAASPWQKRVAVEEMTFENLLQGDGAARYDLIVSNPPFFDAGVSAPSTPRELSRHQASLSPLVLVANAEKLLLPGGRLALIAPAEMEVMLREKASLSGLKTERICFVRDHSSSPIKRVMLEFSHPGPSIAPESNGRKNSNLDPQPEITYLTMFCPDGEPTNEYRRLCGDFYLKF